MKNLLTYILLMLPFFALAQSIDLETFGKPSPFTATGAVSANTVFYESNQASSRQPFTYFAQGNLNFSYYDFSIPVSYSYSNQGDQLGYQLPFNLNRLSLHPKYKWITGHIGDINMTFSPYTLNGHQFTGAGVDLTPEGGLKISALYGRFLKPVEADTSALNVASYKRIGLGFKTVLEKERYTVGVSTFYAIDRENSISINADEEGVLPKENLVLSFEGGVDLTKELELVGEYATTAMSQDIRAEESDEGGKGILSPIFNNRTSTEYYNAYKLGLKYRVQQATLGLGYERIDPGYETLGAYYFNNDFENLTVNLARPFFDNKLNLAFNLGYQRDDLKDQKANATNRFVGAVNATLNATERLSITGSYSNFSTYTNVRINQFDNINDADLLNNVSDSLNYRQISQNANLNVNYVVSKKKTLQQNVNLNYNVSDIANEQGGVVRIGDASTFHNVGTAYTIGLSERNLNITPAVNATYNTIGREDAFTWGPTLSISKGYFENTLNTVFSSSYNTTSNTTGKIDITNFRAGLAYVLWEKHNFSLNAIQLFKRNADNPKLAEFTATFGYSYAFDLLKKHDWKKREKRVKTDNDTIRINYKKYRYEGLPSDISLAILQITKNPEFGAIPKDKQLELLGLEENMVKTENKKDDLYRENAIAYLKSLDALSDFAARYQALIENAYYKLILEGEQADSRLEKEFIALNAQNNDPDFEKTAEFKKDLEVVNQRYEAHKKMLSGLRNWDIFESAHTERLQRFKEANLNKIYKMHFDNRDELDIINFLEYRLADTYHSQDKKNISRR